jgi:hypothetical protein
VDCVDAFPIILQVPVQAFLGTSWAFSISSVRREGIRMYFEMSATSTPAAASLNHSPAPYLLAEKEKKKGKNVCAALA